MTKRNAILIAAGALLLALALLLPSFYTRAFVAALAVLVATLVLIKTRRISSDDDLKESKRSAPDKTRPETFALGKLFEATTTGMREGLLVVDKDMRVVASNPVAHRLFNFPKGKLETQRLTELTRNPAIYSAFLDALNGIERSGVKVETHGPDRLVFDLRAVPLESSNGTSEPQGALGVFIDVTRMERLERVRQEFLSNVSHELRTPLTAILAFVETLETTSVEDRESIQRFLSIIRKNASRMNTLIGDILELSAIEAGNVRVQSDVVELSPLVNDVISSLASKAAERSIGVTNTVPSGTRVFADARRLEQMLTNLIDNAIKFNREGGTVTVSFQQNGGDRILVTDTGEGIPAQYLDRLFERFYRVDRARSREMGGTGLGLAIVKHLARAHGGEVTVTSEVGKGSTFVIELPLSS